MKIRVSIRAASAAVSVSIGVSVALLSGCSFAKSEAGKTPASTPSRVAKQDVPEVQEFALLGFGGELVTKRALTSGAEGAPLEGTSLLLLPEDVPPVILLTVRLKQNRAGLRFQPDASADIGPKSYPFVLTQLNKTFEGEYVQVALQISGLEAFGKELPEAADATIKLVFGEKDSKTEVHLAVRKVVSHLGIVSRSVGVGLPPALTLGDGILAYPIRRMALKNTSPRALTFRLPYFGSGRVVRDYKSQHYTQGECQINKSETNTLATASDRLLWAKASLDENGLRNALSTQTTGDFEVTLVPKESIELIIYGIFTRTQFHPFRLGACSAGEPHLLSSSCVPGACKRQEVTCWTGGPGSSPQKEELQCSRSGVRYNGRICNESNIFNYGICVEYWRELAQGSLVSDTSTIMGVGLLSASLFNSSQVYFTDLARELHNVNSHLADPDPNFGVLGQVGFEQPPGPTPNGCEGI